jgi:hypothetical protein
VPKSFAANPNLPLDTSKAMKKLLYLLALLPISVNAIGLPSTQSDAQWYQVRLEQQQSDINATVAAISGTNTYIVFRQRFPGTFPRNSEEAGQVALKIITNHAGKGSAEIRPGSFRVHQVTSAGRHNFIVQVGRQ